MSAGGRTPVVRMVAEGSLIVLSILLALRVDGWRERRALDSVIATPGR